MSLSAFALKSKNMFKNDLPVCLACLGPHYRTNTAIIAPKLW